MATRAERLRYDLERSGTKRVKGKSNGVHDPLDGTSPTVGQRGPGKGSMGAHGATAARKATHSLDDSVGSTAPSRKSTRKGKNHLKAAAPLTTRQQLRVSAPSRRHASK